MLEEQPQITDNDIFNTITPTDLSALLRSKETLELATGYPTPQISTNPFLTGLKVQTTKKVGGILAVEKLTDEEGNEVGTELRSRKYVDNATFVKVMSACYGIAFEMNSAGQKMLWVLLQQLHRSPLKDIVMLNFSDYDGTTKKKPVFKVGKTTFYVGIRELKKAGFIADYKPKSGMYWVNPAYLFNGDRVRFIQEWVKRNPEVSHKPTVEFPKGVEEFKPELLRKSGQ